MKGIAQRVRIFSAIYFYSRTISRRFGNSTGVRIPNAQVLLRLIDQKSSAAAVAVIWHRRRRQSVLTLAVLVLFATSTRSESTPTSSLPNLALHGGRAGLCQPDAWHDAMHHTNPDELTACCRGSNNRRVRTVTIKSVCFIYLNRTPFAFRGGTTMRRVQQCGWRNETEK